VSSREFGRPADVVFDRMTEAISGLIGLVTLAPPIRVKRDRCPASMVMDKGSADRLE
jgi:hypothetical protein